MVLQFASYLVSFQNVIDLNSREVSSALVCSGGYTTTFHLCALVGTITCGIFSHEFLSLDGCRFEFCGMMEVGGTYLISDLEASFGWILVPVKGGVSWSALNLLVGPFVLGFIF
ncbi:hypothetical protein DVH24_028493 [Malus domestica]|uniref:Uncharacterized protein n=1 Tax=Malus domestica TaxID=3750 RepID=A0A498IZM3_MALDO|nr:hypothetical protein DVH24_028493 [Malus domestica]